jgi:predicted permease
MGSGMTDNSGEEPVRVNGVAVTGDCFATFGVKPLLGRLLTSADDTPHPGAEGFATVISYAWWNARYHRDPGVVGKKLVVEGCFSQQMPIVIVGVLPPDFHGVEAGSDPRIYLPSYWCGADNRDANTNMSMLLFGRLKSVQTLQRAEQELQPAFQDWLRQVKRVGEVKDTSRARLKLAPDAAGYSSLALEYGKGLRLLQALVAIILLAGCFYVSTLFSARAVARRREFAVRAALGASRGRLVTQCLIESAILVCAGAVGGLFIAWASARYIVHFLANGSPDLFLDVRPGGWVLVFAGAVALITLLLTGLLPSWRSTKANVIGDIKQSRTGALSGVKHGFGSVLFPLQIALSLVVIVVATLLSSSLVRGLTQDNGFTLTGTAFVQTDIPMVLPEKDKDGKKLKSTLAMYDDVLNQLNHTPGIQSASADITHPLGGAFYGAGASSKYRQAPKGDADSYLMNWIAPRYFETAGTRVLAGRDFDERDHRGATPVCILNESAARYFYPNLSPIGQIMRESWKGGLSCTVVGVVQDTRFSGIEAKAPFMLYLPIGQTERFLNSAEFFLRTNDIEGAVGTLRRILHKRAGAHVMEVIPVADAVKESLSRTRLLTMLSNTFATLALLLSAVGIFGLLNYSVKRRTAEIGVRMALGASRERVLGMTMREAAAMVLPGLLLGLIAAWAAARLVATLLYQTRPFEPVVFGLSVVVLAIVVGVASYLPARRASRIEPMEALRAE